MLDFLRGGNCSTPLVEILSLNLLCTDWLDPRRRDYDHLTGSNNWFEPYGTCGWVRGLLGLRSDQETLLPRHTEDLSIPTP